MQSCNVNDIESMRLWAQFCATGRVEDYLQYRQHLR